ncbi:A1pp-domain-containing protein [Aulographum hederae CBS 113979]|uniref:A1pp-domain-containing protein n=1 Tax=Aulographum hederae CBS 113979 TaxID=1176131 RepID=A0A6G1HGY3_9PEZI|nr:A1pp-domain-containing protein [Aulographum hederae CBS 113979]
MATVPLNDIPTLAVLYKLNRLHAHPSPSTAPNSAHNAKIAIIRNDITVLEVDSIVNAANESLLGGGGVDGAIHRAAGPDLLAECETLDGCDTGDAKITDAYKLPCKKVVHAVGPIYFREKRKGMHETLLRGCYRRSLELAVQNKMRSIAFSALSTGVYGYPSGEAADAAISEVRNFLDEGHGDDLDRVVFCNFLEKDEKAYHETLPKYFPTPTSERHGDAPETTPAAATKADDEAADLASKLPNAPSGTPALEGQPEAKKLKATHESGAVDDDEKDEDWEKIEKPVSMRATVEDAEDEGDGVKL